MHAEKLPKCPFCQKTINYTMIVPPHRDDIKGCCYECYVKKKVSVPNATIDSGYKIHGEHDAR